MSKPKTQAQLDHIASKRLEKKYGRDLAWYEEQIKIQGGGCGLCGSKPGTRRLHVDHDHKWTKAKIRTIKYPAGVADIKGQWEAEATYRGIDYVCYSSKRNLAIQEVKGYLKRASVRSLLCFRCNSFVVGFNDPELLRKAADYIEEHQRGDKAK